MNVKRKRITAASKRCARITWEVISVNARNCTKEPVITADVSWKIDVSYWKNCNEKSRISLTPSSCRVSIFGRSTSSWFSQVCSDSFCFSDISSSQTIHFQLLTVCFFLTFYYLSAVFFKRILNSFCSVLVLESQPKNYVFSLHWI